MLGLAAVAVAAGFELSSLMPDAPPRRIVALLAGLGAVVSLAVLLTITLRREGTKRLHREATLTVLERYRTLLENLGAVVWEFDVDEQRLSIVSPLAGRLLGYPEGAWEQSRDLWIEAQHPDDRPRAMALLARVAAGSRDEQLEHRVIAKDGHEVWMQTAMRAGRGAEGHVLIRGVSIDVTAHQRARADLQHTLSLLRATLDSTTDGILVVDPEGHITSFNQKFVDMWRIPEDVMRSGLDEKALEVAIRQLAEPEQFLAKVHELYADAEATSFDVLEFQDGRVFERWSQPQRLEGQSVGRVWSFRDVTERVRAERALRQSEEQLRQAQKMEAVGQLAGGVAHDFNNILTAVVGNLGMILEDPQASVSVRRRARDIQLAADRAAALTRQLLAFSRRQMLEFRVEDLNHVVGEMQELLSVTLGDSIRLVVSRAPVLCPVLVDRGQMEQVILNLALNARDAMPKGGRLTIATRLVEADEHPAVLERPAVEGRHVLLTVSDTGTGMDPETSARIFEPFFTTKERSKGTGLGLSTAYGIVRQSGGSIHVESRPGEGTTFEILLPYCDESVTIESAPASPSAARGGYESVLVVEDEPAVRALMCEALGRAGYRVLEASNGADALEVATAFPGRLHLLVTDVVMPGMSGRELAARLLAVRPGVRVMYMSGYAESEVVNPGALDPSVALLPKPFSMEALARRVREALDAHATV